MALDFFAGFLGGTAGVVVGHPLDTIKVRLQTDDPKKPRYRGTTHCFVTILEKESAHGLYKGMSSPLAGVSVVNAVAFGTYGAVIRNLETDNSMSSILFNHGVAGAAGGLVQTPLASTLELAKTRMQLQSQGQGWSHFLGPGAYLGGRWHRSKIPLPYSGPIDCMRRIWRKEGTRGIFRGLGITIVRDVPGFAYYFASYEMFCKLLSSTPGEMLPHWKLLVAGGLSGMVSWIGTYPLDVVKSRIQADGATGPRKYSGYVDCVRQSLREEGLRVFGRGLTSTLIRAFIVNAATFAVVTWVLRFVGNMADNWEFPLPYNQLPDQHHPFIPLTRNQFPSPSSVILEFDSNFHSTLVHLIRSDHGTISSPDSQPSSSTMEESSEAVKRNDTTSISSSSSSNSNSSSNNSSNNSSSSSSTSGFQPQSTSSTSSSTSLEQPSRATASAGLVDPFLLSNPEVVLMFV